MVLFTEKQHVLLQLNGGCTTLPHLKKHEGRCSARLPLTLHTSCNSLGTCCSATTKQATSLLRSGLFLEISPMFSMKSPLFFWKISDVFNEKSLVSWKISDVFNEESLVSGERNLFFAWPSSESNEEVSNCRGSVRHLLKKLAADLCPCPSKRRDS